VTGGAASVPEGGAPPLVVDLDGTLVLGDTTLGCMLALRRRPLRLLRALWRLPRGRAHVKQRLAAAASLDAARLPYNRELLRYLREQRRAGRKLVLATGADRSIAEAVARHLGLFDAVLASDGRINLTGSRKLSAISRQLQGAAFAYIGNSKTDLVIWGEAASGVCVNARPRVARAAARATRIERSFARRPFRLYRLLARPERKA
jgi:phosphoserine phosphatase